TITRPEAEQMCSTARRKDSPSRGSRASKASASVRITRRARASSVSPSSTGPDPGSAAFSTTPPVAGRSPGAPVMDPLLRAAGRGFSRRFHLPAPDPAVLVHEPAPLAPRLEERLGELPHGAVSAGPARHPTTRGAHLRHRVRNRYG